MACTIPNEIDALRLCFCPFLKLFDLFGAIAATLLKEAQLITLFLILKYLNIVKFTCINNYLFLYHFFMVLFELYKNIF